MTARNNNNNNNGQGVAQGGNVGGGPPAVVNVAQEPLDNQNPPKFGNESISGSTGAPPGHNYYGPPQAFNNRCCQPAPSNNHQHGLPYPNNNNYSGHRNAHGGVNPGGNPGGGGKPGGGAYRDTYRSFLPLFMGFAKIRISLPMLPVPVQRFLLRAVVIFGLPGMFTRVIEIDTMIDTGAMIGTANLIGMVEFCKKYPWLAKAIIDSTDGEFHEISLAGAIRDRKCLNNLSATLPFLIEIYTSWARVSYGITVTIMYACGEFLSCRNIPGLSKLMDMGAQLDLKSMRFLNPHWSCKSLELILKEPTDQPYNIDSLKDPLVAQYIYYEPDHDITKKIHLACNTLHARHIQPVLEARSTGSSAPGFGSCFHR